MSDSHSNVLFRSVLRVVFDRYYSATADVLMSVKKVEDSLKRLKKNRGTEKTTGSQGMTDDDKIRQQFIVDIENYGAQVLYITVMI